MNETLWAEYGTDIHSWLKNKESAGPSCKRQSPQLGKRGHLVEWILRVHTRLGMSKGSLFLSVRLLDLFMDGHDIQDPQLYLVCLGSLLLAAKLEEKDGKIPRCSQLNVFVKNFFPLSDFYNLEFVMLTYFQWNIVLPTAHAFCDLLLPNIVHDSDLHNGGPLLCRDSALEYFKVYLDHFLMRSLHEPTFIDCLPSIIASAVIFASRVSFGLTPRWPARLETLTGHPHSSLETISSVLLLNHCVRDEGYESFTSTPITPGINSVFMPVMESRCNMEMD